MISLITKAQSYDQWVMGSAGSMLSGVQFTAEYSMGEPITGFIQTAFFSAQQGYHVFEEKGSSNHIVDPYPDGLNIYPVPFHDKIVIKGIVNFEQGIWVQLKDVTGKTRYSRRVSAAGNSVVLEDLSNLSKGYYILKVIDDGKTYVYPILKE